MVEPWGGLGVASRVVALTGITPVEFEHDGISLAAAYPMPTVDAATGAAALGPVLAGPVLEAVEFPVDVAGPPVEVATPQLADIVPPPAIGETVAPELVLPPTAFEFAAPPGPVAVADELPGDVPPAQGLVDGAVVLLDEPVALLDEPVVLAVMPPLLTKAIASGKQSALPLVNPVKAMPSPHSIAPMLRLSSLNSISRFLSIFDKL